MDPLVVALAERDLYRIRPALRNAHDAVALVERDLYHLRPALRNAHDAVAFALHLYWIHAGCVGIVPEAAADPAAHAGNCPPAWNRAHSTYCFVYILQPGRANTIRNDSAVAEEAVPAGPQLVTTMRCRERFLIAQVENRERVVTSMELCVDDYVIPDADFAGDPRGIFSTLPGLLLLAEERLVRPALGASGVPMPDSAAAVPAASRHLDGTRDHGVARDTLRISEPVHLGRRFPGAFHAGDFDGDIDSFPGRGGMPQSGGMRIGPNHPIFGKPGGRPFGGGPGPGPRYDPIHPFGNGEPDFDELAPPKPGGGPN